MSVDRDKSHCFVTIVRSMDGVPEATGIPGLDSLKPALANAGFELSGFELVDPARTDAVPTSLQPLLEKLRALRDVVVAQIEEVESLGEVEEGEDDDLRGGVAWNVENAWRELRDLCEA